jgi:hypothetical protein
VANFHRKNPGQERNCNRIVSWWSCSWRRARTPGNTNVKPSSLSTLSSTVVHSAKTILTFNPSIHSCTLCWNHPHFQPYHPQLYTMLKPSSLPTLSSTVVHSVETILTSKPIMHSARWKRRIVLYKKKKSSKRKFNPVSKLSNYVRW